MLANTASNGTGLDERVKRVKNGVTIFASLFFLCLMQLLCVMVCVGVGLSTVRSELAVGSRVVAHGRECRRCWRASNGSPQAGTHCPAGTDQRISYSRILPAIGQGAAKHAGGILVAHGLPLRRANSSVATVFVIRRAQGSSGFRSGGLEDRHRGFDVAADLHRRNES